MSGIGEVPGDTGEIAARTDFLVFMKTAPEDILTGPVLDDREEPYRQPAHEDNRTRSAFGQARALNSTNPVADVQRLEMEGRLEAYAPLVGARNAHQARLREELQAGDIGPNNFIHRRVGFDMLLLCLNHTELKPLLRILDRELFVPNIADCMNLTELTLEDATNYVDEVARMDDFPPLSGLRRGVRAELYSQIRFRNSQSLPQRVSVWPADVKKAFADHRKGADTAAFMVHSSLRVIESSQA